MDYPTLVAIFFRQRGQRLLLSVTCHEYVINTRNWEHPTLPNPSRFRSHNGFSPVLGTQSCSPSFFPCGALFIPRIPWSNTYCNPMHFFQLWRTFLLQYGRHANGHPPIGLQFIFAGNFKEPLLRYPCSEAAIIRHAKSTSRTFKVGLKSYYCRVRWNSQAVDKTKTNKTKTKRPDYPNLCTNS